MTRHTVGKTESSRSVDEINAGRASRAAGCAATARGKLHRISPVGATRAADGDGCRSAAFIDAE